jgi:hypothetical protein
MVKDEKKKYAIAGLTISILSMLWWLVSIAMLFYTVGK